LLNLHGETCNREILYEPEFPIYRPHFILERMPLGLTDKSAPIQSIELRNDSLTTLDLHLELIDQDEEFEVFSLPKHNISIHEKSRFSIPLIFRPLEAKKYECEIAVSMNGKKKSIFVKACGFDPNVSPELVKHQTLDPLYYPSHASCDLPNELASLSTELLDFGCVITRSWNHQLLHLTNSTSDNVEFSWDQSVNMFIFTQIYTALYCKCW